MMVWYGVWLACFFFSQVRCSAGFSTVENQLKPVVWKEDEVQHGFVVPWFYEVNIEKTI